MKVMFVARLTRVDTIMPITYLSSRTNKATLNDLVSLKRVIRYLENYKDRGITIHCTDLRIVCWCDASFTAHINPARSHTGYIISCGTRLSYLHARSGKQKSGATSSTCLWMREVLNDIKHTPLQSVLIYQDNTSAIDIVKDGTEVTKKSKHLHAKVGAVHHQLIAGRLQIEHLGTDSMTADVLTKPLSHEVILRHTSHIMGDSYLVESLKK